MKEMRVLLRHGGQVTHAYMFYLNSFLYYLKTWTSRDPFSEYQTLFQSNSVAQPQLQSLHMFYYCNNNNNNNIKKKKNTILTEIEKKRKTLVRKTSWRWHHSSTSRSKPTFINLIQSCSEEFGSYLLHLGGNQSQSKTKCIWYQKKFFQENDQIINTNRFSHSQNWNSHLMPKKELAVL